MKAQFENQLRKFLSSVPENIKQNKIDLYHKIVSLRLEYYDFDTEARAKQELLEEVDRYVSIPNDVNLKRIMVYYDVFIEPYILN